MFEFILNGKKVSVEEDKKLIDYLRDDLRLTSVKDGCSEGTCGACTVLIDGKPRRSCIFTTRRVDGKEVITVEGLSEREKQVYAWAFAKAGAVQCGFCIPAMVLSAKALIDKNLTPTREDVKKAIRSNICRCTGYKKIEEAIMMAAKAFRDKFVPPKTCFKGLVGEEMYRLDAKPKVLGTGKYANDIYVDGMIYGSAVRLDCARALIKKIDTTKAEQYPGVVAVVTAEDVPGQRYIGHLVKDWPALIAEGEETRCVGDAIALVAAKDKGTLEKAKKLVNIEYEVLEPITSPKRALSEDAPKIHAKGNLLTKEVLKRGNVDEAIKNSKYVVTKKYYTPFTEHAFMEPECAVAMPYQGDGVLIYTGSQSIFDEQREVSELLGLPKEKIRVKSCLVGGGFGGKEDMSVQHHAALLAWITKKPVKVALSRKESIRVHPKRHPMEMEFTTACDEEGKITAMKVKVVADTGAYASLGGPVLQRACTHAGGPYNFQNMEVVGLGVYTNNPPCGAFRGFGVTQTTFARECNLNLLAKIVGISEWEIRYRNAIKPGDVLPNGQIADESTALEETLLAVKDKYQREPYVGIACAFKNTGLGVGVPDFGRCRLTVIDGKVHLRTSAACMGQGVATVMLQIVCETTGLSPEDIVVEAPDTFVTPDAGTSTASRQTLFTGEATRRAANKLRKVLNNKSLKELDGYDVYGEYEGKTDSINSTKENPISHIAYGYATHLVTLDNNGKLKEVVAVHDVGEAINPLSVEGQIEGGVVMGLGYALTESFPLKEGVPTANFGRLGLLRANQVPNISSIIVERKGDILLAYGAKGVGEISSIPTAPAVQGAYFKYDGVFRTNLPLENTFYRKRKKK